MTATRSRPATVSSSVRNPRPSAGWGCVGTANFDNRSFALSAETNVCFHDGALVDQLHGIFVADLARCEKIELSEWRRRGLRQRTKERLAWLIEDQV